MSRFTRREFTRLGLLALPAIGLSSKLNLLSAAESAKPKPPKANSLVNGVHLGLNVPYSLGNNNLSGDETLAACLQLGVGFLELRAQPVEAFLGAPMLVPLPRRVAGGPEITAAQKAATEESAAALEKWRRTAPIARAAEFRRKYEDAGVFIEVVKYDGFFRMSEESLDYAFGLAKALGAGAISTEISFADDDLKRIGAAATRHRMRVATHGHASVTADIWEHAFTFSDYYAANVDLGHFVAGNNVSPVPFIKKHHDRITHVHVKDRKLNNGANVPFGEGDTPITEVLQLIRDQRWPIEATIEFEYPIPTGSTRMAEISRALDYCRKALA